MKRLYWFLLGLVVLVLMGATLPPPILRQVLTTNNVAVGTAGQFLTRVGIDGLAFSNLSAHVPPVSTNLATAADQAIDLSSDSLVSITNAVAGAVNVWLTNAVDRKYFVLRCVADGSARTLSFTNASGLTINVINTNGFSVTTLPQCPVTANKIATFAGRVWISAGVTNVDMWGNVQP